MGKHTPGLWGIFNIDNYTVGECENTKTLGRVIAVTAHHSVNPFYGIENEEARANARLRAAAPDLLKALKNVLPGLSALNIGWATLQAREIMGVIEKAEEQS